MRGLTTVARLPGSGNGRHLALEAQDFGKAPPPLDTGTSLAEDAQRMLARIEEEVRASVIGLLAGKTMSPELQAQVAQGISAAIDAHLTGIAAAGGASVSGSLMGRMVWDEAAPIEPMQWMGLNSKGSGLIKPLTITRKLTDDEIAMFKESTTLPISAGFDFGGAGAEFEYHYPQRDRQIDPAAVPFGVPSFDDRQFLAARQVPLFAVSHVLREESRTVYYVDGATVGHEVVVRFHEKEPPPRQVAFDTQRRRFVSADVKGSVDLGDPVSIAPTKGAGITGLSGSFGTLTAHLNLAPQKTGEETLNHIVEVFGLRRQDLHHCRINYDTMKGTAEVQVPAELAPRVRYRWGRQCDSAQTIRTGPPV